LSLTIRKTSVHVPVDWLRETPLRLNTECERVSTDTRLKDRDVPDIRFRMAGYPAVFYYPVPVPAQLFPETRYLNRIAQMWPRNLTKLLVCSGLKPFLA